MDRAAFEQLLQQAMGLDAASIGSSIIERAVQDRQAACGLGDLQAYWEHVRASATELQELIEAVVVSETWFFRDREAYTALARLGHEEWLRRPAHEVLRLLSLPCSTGEEPYSMAMALLDAGVPPERFHIDAVDISTRALAQARRAVYGRNSFRGADLDFRDRYFDATPQGYRLHDAVRVQVQLQQGNLLAAGFLPGAGIYDVIFCRNVLIYFDRATQDRAIAVLRRLLTARGTLFVGPAETGLLLDHDFVSSKLPLAFAFRQAAAAPAKAERPRPVPPPRQAVAVALLPRPVRPHARRAAAAPAPASVPATPFAAGLDAATRLADQGHLAEAARLCDAQLREQAPSAAAFHLMGLIRNAAGNLAEAAQCFRKALYLDPNHHEALAHLAFLLDKQGDAAGAQALRNRVQRLARKAAK